MRTGVLTPADALEIVDISLQSAANQPDAEATLEAAEIARICLEGVREALAEMAAARAEVRAIRGEDVRSHPPRTTQSHRNDHPFGLVRE